MESAATAAEIKLDKPEEGDPFGIVNIKIDEPENKPEADADDAQGDADDDGIDNDDDSDGGAHTDDEAEPAAKPRKRTAVTRISDLSNKLKEKDAEMAELRQKLENLTAAKDYFASQDKKPDAPDLDAQLQEAAKLAGDSEFDPDDFSTDAEKKTALRAYNLEIKQRQQEAQQRVYGVRDQYAQAVQHFQQEQPEVAQGLIAAYQAAVADEARAIRYRFDMSEQEALQHAERALLQDAANRKNPVEHIAKYGYEILEYRKPALQSKKESAKIDHRGREAAKDRAGKPEIDSAPSGRMSAQQIRKEFADIGF